MLLACSLRNSSLSRETRGKVFLHPVKGRRRRESFACVGTPLVETEKATDTVHRAHSRRRQEEILTSTITPSRCWPPHRLARRPADQHLNERVTAARPATRPCTRNFHRPGNGPARTSASQAVTSDEVASRLHRGRGDYHRRDRRLEHSAREVHRDCRLQRGVTTRGHRFTNTCTLRHLWDVVAARKSSRILVWRQGTMSNVPSWSPDGKQIAFVSNTALRCQRRTDGASHVSLRSFRT